MIFPISSRFQFMISALYYKYTTRLPCMALSNWHCGLVSAISFVSMVRLSANVNTPRPSPSIFAPALSFVFPCVCIPVCISYHHCVCHIRAMSIINTNVTEILYNTIHCNCDFCESITEIFVTPSSLMPPPPHGSLACLTRICFR